MRPTRIPSEDFFLLSFSSCSTQSAPPRRRQRERELDLRRQLEAAQGEIARLSLLEQERERAGAAVSAGLARSLAVPQVPCSGLTETALFLDGSRTVF